MKHLKALFIKLFAGLITAGIIYAIHPFSIFGKITLLELPDWAAAVSPGWHTTIYPPVIMNLIYTVLLLALTFITYHIYKGSLRFFTYL